MAVFLDSAILEEARAAADLGFVAGVTTNPALLAKAGHADPVAAIAALCRLLPGTVFYQLTSHGLPEMFEEYQRIRETGPNLGLKIPCTLVGLRFAAQVAREAPVAVTSVFHPGQAYLAAEAGARYAIPYVNRLSRMAGDGPGRVGTMLAAVRGSGCAVLAAGIKSAEEATATVLAGAQHLSLPLAVLQAMAENTLSEHAIAEFDAVVATQGWG